MDDAALTYDTEIRDNGYSSAPLALLDELMSLLPPGGRLACLGEGDHGCD